MKTFIDIMKNESVRIGQPIVINEGAGTITDVFPGGVEYTLKASGESRRMTGLPIFEMKE